MIFALIHATLGWMIALLACAVLARRPASVRCWAWRLGLLKGPLALILAVPVVTVALDPSPIQGTEPSLSSPVSPRPLRQEELGGEGSKAVPSAASPPQGVSTPSMNLGVVAANASRPSDAASLPQKIEAQHSRASLSLFSMLYPLGVAAVAAARFLALRRIDQRMPRVEGALRPRVVIPDGMAPEAAAMALAHESAHVRRRDPQWSLVADLVCALFWFAPPAWLCARSMRMESESACDAAVLAETRAAKRDYARLLLAFAGPAPANALGGPARRLSRRILMLDKVAKPLPRLTLACLLAFALLALLPWRAVAAPQQGPESGPLHGFGSGVPATGIPLQTAASLMLEEPGVRAKVAWTAAQDAQAESAQARWQRTMNEYRTEMSRRQKTGPLRDFYRWDLTARPAAFARADNAARWPAQTPEQTRRLKSLALTRFGSAVWKDPEVLRRLRLTPEQVAAVTKENAVIAKASRHPDMRGQPLHPVPKMPKSVMEQVRAAEAAYVAAPPERRAALSLRIANLRRPYEPRFKGQSPERYRALVSAMLARSWRMRAEADHRLEALLTPEQRQALHTLQTDPDAWTEREAGSMRIAPQGLQAIEVRLPARTPLRDAAARLLREPDVRHKLRLSKDQEETLILRTYAGNLRLLENRRRDALSNLKKFPAGSRDPMAQATRMELRKVVRDEAETRRKIAQTRPSPLTAEQRRSLVALVLSRYGGAVWEDAIVASSLQLTHEQLAAVKEQNDAIQANLLNDHSPGEFGGAITALESKLRQRDLTAKERAATQKDLEAYQRMARRYRRASQERDPRFWKIRGTADARLEALLTPDQRRRLEALRKSGNEWPNGPDFLPDSTSASAAP